MLPLQRGLGRRLSELLRLYNLVSTGVSITFDCHATLVTFALTTGFDFWEHIPWAYLSSFSGYVTWRARVRVTSRGTTRGPLCEKLLLN